MSIDVVMLRGARLRGVMAMMREHAFHVVTDGAGPAAPLLPDARPYIEEADDAHANLAELRFLHQLRRVQSGLPRQLDPYTLSRTRQSILQTALATIRKTQDIVARRHGMT